MKREVDIKSVYLMSSEFGLKSGKPMLKILIAGGSNKRGGWHFQLKSLIGGWGGGGGCNSLKWLAFSKFHLIEGMVVTVGGGS